MATNEPTLEQLGQERASLMRLDRKALESEYKRHHRVSDTKGVSKGCLADDILTARHGRKRIERAYAAGKAAR